MQSFSLSIRVSAAKPDHHLWNNNGTWWCHYTLHRGPRKQRCRISLETREHCLARARRDELFAALRRLSSANEPQVPRSPADEVEQGVHQ